MQVATFVIQKLFHKTAWCGMVERNKVYCMVVNFIVFFADRSSPENNEIMLYDSVKMEPDVTETADNPQNGDTMKQSDTTANPTPNENAYSYAIP